MFLHGLGPEPDQRPVSPPKTGRCKKSREVPPPLTWARHDANLARYERMIRSVQEAAAYFRQLSRSR